MTRLIIQIPALNEADQLAETLAALPRSIAGIDEIEYLIIDDGSSDSTGAIAQANGAHHVVRNKKTLGLAATFQVGLEACLKLGADIIVNTDADNQYRGSDIETLIRPILINKADIVIGDRQLKKTKQFAPMKTWFQIFGSSIVSSLSGTKVPDAVSGFRAISSSAAVRLKILSRFSYTTEMIIQAGNKNLVIQSVPVSTNTVTRPPRLYQSTTGFVLRQAVTILRMYAMYRPMRFFFSIGAVLAFIGVVPLLRFLFFFAQGEGGGHVQSLVLGSAFLILGATFAIAGLLADLVSQNRKILEETLERARREDLAAKATQPENPDSDSQAAAIPTSQRTAAKGLDAGKSAVRR
ncbi:MAG: glycosyltransferase family 2 protein [Pseudomonadota bacterium]